MRPRLLAILAVSSLACGLLLCTLWVRSYWRSDALGHSHPGSVWGTTGDAGCVELCWIAGFEGESIPLSYVSGPARWRDEVEVSRRLPGGWGWSLAGFGVSGWAPAERTVRQVTFPHWFPVLLTLIPPALWWRRRRRRRARGFPVEMAAADA